MPVMEGLLKQSYTLDQFKEYLKAEVAPKMGAWRPKGVVLHNTGIMVWPGFDVRGVQITPAQRMENMSVDWVSRGFHGGPHLLISPDGMINTLWPLWMYGTHSPSWNKTFWGMEMVGDFDKEPFPNVMREAAVGAMKALYAMIGQEITGDTFHLHKEDPLSTHKRCPGINCGDKALWLARLRSHDSLPHVATGVGAGGALANLPVGTHKHLMVFSEGMKAKLKSMEAFRDKSYLLKDIWHIGWGFRDGFRGLRVDQNTTMTLSEADKLFDESVAIMGDTINQMLTVEVKQCEFDALGLFSWNLGTGALSGSTLLKKLNAGDNVGASDEFMKWVKLRENGVLVFSQALSDRRNTERAIFLGLIDLNPVKPVPVVLPPVAHIPAPMAPKPEIKPPVAVLEAMPLWGTFVVWLMSILKGNKP